ncbi:methylated-DNA--[protein]-cysteine S-methyltransferase [Christiangramia aquimixticola]|uniref:methylated-DNA--[protein]-cysteine S-methyltransferase n=1 Tax=Christiangramia aquimixticola TaxID=1697558 RepID=UPI003AA8B88D
MKAARFKTPLGTAEIRGSEEGICSIKILEGDPGITEIPLELQPAVEQLEAYFAGELKDFHLKLDPKGTEFQKQVWKKLAEIPFGTTTSYLQLSKELGNEKAIRAVAAANGKNPLWIVIPCHRVIGSDGSLTGYAGGLHHKKWLLEHENPPLQQSLF